MISSCSFQFRNIFLNYCSQSTLVISADVSIARVQIFWHIFSEQEERVLHHNGGKLHTFYGVKRPVLSLSRASVYIIEIHTVCVY